MDTMNSLLGASVIILAPLGIAVRLIRTHLFEKLDPDRKFHSVTFGGCSYFSPFTPDVPEKMLRINKYTQRTTAAIWIIFGTVVLLVVISKVV